MDLETLLDAIVYLSGQLGLFEPSVHILFNSSILAQTTSLAIDKFSDKDLKSHVFEYCLISPFVEFSLKRLASMFPFLSEQQIWILLNPGAHFLLQYFFY